MSRVSHLLNSSAELWRYSRASDGMGGWVQTWVKVADVRARFSQPSARDRVLADQSQSRLTHVVYLNDTQDVRREDELRRNGVMFKVLAVFEPSEPGTYLRADCEARQPNTGQVT